jgi:hypothetical protein
VVTNTVANVTSNGAVLTVNVPPTITAQPSGATIKVGDNHTFTVVASGTTPLSYEWRKGGGTISGATGASYTVSSAAIGDAGSYTVIVTNVAGSVTSTAASLVVNAN